MGLHVEGLSMALGGMVGDGIPGLHAVGILTVLGLAQAGLLPGVSGECKSQRQH